MSRMTPSSYYTDDNEDDTAVQFGLFREALAAVLMASLSQPPEQPKTRRRAKARAGRDRARQRRGGKSAASVDRVVSESPPDRATAVSASVDPPDPLDPPDTPVRATVVSASVDPPDTPDNDDLAEFVDYVAHASFAALPPDLRTLDRATWRARPALQTKYGPVQDAAGDDADCVARLLPTLDPSAVDSVEACTGQAVGALLAPALAAYLSAVTEEEEEEEKEAPPPSRGDAAACEICGRDWVPLTYHHLIPRFVHAKAVKRGWHRPADLQNVAWLCGACHRAVHRFADHETLAREYYTVERLLAAPEMEKFGRWASRLRWKGR